MKIVTLTALALVLATPAFAWKPGDSLPPIVNKQDAIDAARVVNLGNGRFANLPPLADTRDAKRFYDTADRRSGGSNAGGDSGAQ